MAIHYDIVHQSPYNGALQDQDKGKGVRERAHTRLQEQNVKIL